MSAILSVSSVRMVSPKRLTDQLVTGCRQELGADKRDVVQQLPFGVGHEDDLPMSAFVQYAG